MVLIYGCGVFVELGGRWRFVEEVGVGGFVGGCLFW